MIDSSKDSSSDSVRQHALQCAKNFKTNWIELGRVLYAINKDKLYKNWGFSTFEIYIAKEVNIRKLTALKLLRSYYFLEKEEPQYLKDDYIKDVNPAVAPSYETVDVLRLAKNKKTLDAEDYADLKKNIFQKGKDVREIKKDLTVLMRQREDVSADEAWQRKRESHIKRLISTLKSLKTEIETNKILPSTVLKDLKSLIGTLESQLQRVS